MKKFVYQLFLVADRNTDWQTDVCQGYFTALPEVRRAIRDIMVKHLPEVIDPEDFDVYRHNLNPTCFATPTKVKHIF